MSTETPDPSAHPSPHPPRGLRWWDVVLPAVGIVLIVVGVAVLMWSAAHPASFGWYAYAPLSATMFPPNAGMVRGGWGFGSVALGAVVLAFWAGLLVGRRAR